MKHNGYYTYGNTLFSGWSEKVIVTCPTHGDFSIRSSNHRSGQGCPTCSKEAGHKKLKKSFADFEQEGKDKHDSKYSYYSDKYTGASDVATLMCPVHGDFTIKARKHLEGQGCKACANDLLSSTLSDCLKLFNAAHGDAYDYSAVDYKGNKHKVKIICRTHGIFEQAPHHHSAGSGCPHCADYGFNGSKAGSLYVLTDGELTKVGITNRDVADRVRNVNARGKQFKILADFKFPKGEVAKFLESVLLDHLRKYYSQPSDKFDGYTECFYEVDINSLLSQIRILGGFDEPSYCS